MRVGALSLVSLVVMANVVAASRLSALRPAFAAGLPSWSTLKPSRTASGHGTPSALLGGDRRAGAFEGPRKFSSLSLRKVLELTRMKESEVSSPPVEEEFDPGEIEGTDLRVLKYPHPKLRAEDEEVTVFDDALKQTCKELFMVMYACKGVGLAAPQVGINKKIMVFNPEGDKKKWLKEVTLVNPVIVAQSEATDVEAEGCLSFPGMDGKVRRNKWVKIEAKDVKGKPIKKKYEGWEARVFQHEYDHLLGKVYIDRLDEEERERVQPVLDGLIQKYKDEHGDDFKL